MNMELKGEHKTVLIKLKGFWRRRSGRHEGWKGEGTGRQEGRRGSGRKEGWRGRGSKMKEGLRGRGSGRQEESFNFIKSGFFPVSIKCATVY